MDATPVSFANRCLPLKIANQSGWVIRSGCSFSARRSDSYDPGSSVLFEFEEGAAPQATSAIQDLFGLGIITFHVPYLFRTEPGYAIIARGAPNFIVPGAYPLEGVIETDWTPATFTMNWRLMDADASCLFQRGDPLCFIQPIQLAELEAVDPHIEPIESDAALNAEFRAWKMSRLAFNMDPAGRTSDWQKDYFRGPQKQTTAGSANEYEHRTRMNLREFE